MHSFQHKLYTMSPINHSKLLQQDLYQMLKFTSTYRIKPQTFLSVMHDGHPFAEYHMSCIPSIQLRWTRDIQCIRKSSGICRGNKKSSPQIPQLYSWIKLFKISFHLSWFFVLVLANLCILLLWLNNSHNFSSYMSCNSHPHHNIHGCSQHPNPKGKRKEYLS